jgi:hypothetical protein
MTSHHDSGVAKGAMSVAKPVAAVRSRVARKSISGSAKSSAAKGKAGAAAVRTSKAAKDASAKPAKKSGHAKSDDRSKVEKEKLIRDSFTIPESEYDLIAAIKKRCLAKGMAVKKSEVLRAAIITFAALNDAAVTKALKAVEVLKTGRPPGTR